MSEENKVTTAQRLAQVMNERHLKQVDILDLCRPYCEQMGEKINKSHLSQWLRGINEPSQRKLTILALALDVSEPWLMGYNVKQSRRVQLDYIPMITPVVPGMDIISQDSGIHALLMVGISRLNDNDARKLLDVAKAIFPGKFEWGDET